MRDEGDDAGAGFWPFSLALYAQPGVAGTCLRLQDTQGIDVNVLFFVLFLASHGRCVSADEVRRIDAHIEAWRVQVVKPLRKLRRALKTGIAPLAVDTAANLRNAIKREELAAERLQQQALEQAFPVTSTGMPSAVHTALSANLAAYSTLVGALDADALHLLKRTVLR